MEEGPAQKLRCIDACGQQVHARNICMTQEDILKDVGIPLFDHEYPIRVRYLCTYVPMMNSNFSDASDEKRFTLRI